MAHVTPTPIVALDVATAAGARALVDLLGESCRFYKVGTELFTAVGPPIVRALRERGCDVFLDLKLHDIPTTVRLTARSAAGLGVRLLTVHATGGRPMMEAAVEGTRAASARSDGDGTGDGCSILAVSVLTSVRPDVLGEAWGREGERLDVAAEVLRLSDLAAAAGVHGVVCGGEEAAAVRARHGTLLRLLVPGVRLPGGSAHDQARVVTPRAAVAAGADYLVVGRAVTGAEDPPAAMRQVLEALR